MQSVRLLYIYNKSFWNIAVFFIKLGTSISQLDLANFRKQEQGAATILSMKLDERSITALTTWMRKALRQM